jgi:hypothetical protein
MFPHTRKRSKSGRGFSPWSPVVVEWHAEQTYSDILEYSSVSHICDVIVMSLGGRGVDMDAAAIMHMRTIYLELSEHDVGGRVLQQEPLELGLQALQLPDVLLLLVNVLWKGWRLEVGRGMA